MGPTYLPPPWSYILSFVQQELGYYSYQDQAKTFEHTASYLAEGCYI